MSYSYSFDLADGKYTYICDNGVQEALRYGKPWRKKDLVGDNLIYSMGAEIQRLREELDLAIHAIENSGVDYEEVVGYLREE